MEKKGKILDFASYYGSGLEWNRLRRDTAQLERERSKAILEKHLPPPPGVIYDVGGGPGYYACWLAKKGYEVHLIDPVPLHIEQTTAESAKQPDFPVTHAEVGDAREIERKDETADVVLFFGPLYHLTERDERIYALREALRVLRDGGLLFAVGISRFASLFDGLYSGFFDDPEFARIVERDLVDGQHRNHTENAQYFTDAYFHKPDELKQEMEEAGFQHLTTLGIEGPGVRMADFDKRWKDDVLRKRIMYSAAKVEAENSLLGLSPHLMCIGKK